MIRPTTEFGGALLVVLMLSTTTEAVAQSLEDAFRQTLREAAETSKLGNAFQSLSIFGATPGVSTAFFDVDQKEPGTDFALRTAKLPISHDFAPVIAGIRPYGELTLGYAHADDTVSLDLVPGEATRINADFDAYSALAGIGATIPIVPHLSLRPIFLAGYSRITGDARFRRARHGAWARASNSSPTPVTITSTRAISMRPTPSSKRRTISACSTPGRRSTDRLRSPSLGARHVGSASRDIPTSPEIRRTPSISTLSSSWVAVSPSSTRSLSKESPASACAPR